MYRGQALLKGLGAYLKLARFENAALPSFALVAGFTIVQAHNYQQLTLTVLMFIVAHSVVTIWNDIADETGDKHNNITAISDLRKSGVYKSVRLFIGLSILIIIAVLISLPVLTRLLAAVFFILGWAYNESPIRASHRPVMSIILLGLAYGAVPFLLGASLGSFSLAAILLALGWTIGRASLSLLKDYKDAKGDVLANKRTFLLVYGGTFTSHLSFILAFIGYLGCVVVVSLSVHRAVTTLLLLAGIAVWLLFQRGRLFKANNYISLNQIFHECLRYQLVFDGFAVLCLLTL